MTHTVTLLANHKGITVPRVIGDEYVVDANININSYTEDGEVITASSLGLDTITAVVISGAETASGVALERFVVELSTAGEYESTGSFKLVGTTASSGSESANSDLGMVRIRAYGNI